MVHMMNTTRAARPNKEKLVRSANKSSAQSDQSKPSQTAKHKDVEDSDLEAKIKKIIECTGRSKDDAVFALHDCDYDLQRAIETILENQDKGEWTEKKGRKKKPPVGKAEGENAVSQTIAQVDHGERLAEREQSNSGSANNERSSSAPRGGGAAARRNDRAPPRFQRAAAAGRGRSDEDRADSFSRDRGRGRGRNVRGRGRAAKSSLPRREFNERSSFENEPHIDTWTNETAATKPSSNSFGTWGDMSEDWNNDEWTGSLKESKVFTPSQDTKTFSADNDAKMFSVANIESQVYNSSVESGDLTTSASLSSRSAASQPAGSTAAQQHLPQASSLNVLTHDALRSDPMPQKPIGQNSLGQSSIGHMGQRLDLGMLLGNKPSDESTTTMTMQTEELAKQTANFMAQFTKQATETIKNAVGLGVSSRDTDLNATDEAIPEVDSCAPPTSDQRAVGQSPIGQQSLQQRSKKTKAPPRSKIPQSAVVMPGGNNYNAGLDVKFGTWEQGDSPGFNFVAVSTSSQNTFSQPVSSMQKYAQSLNGSSSQQMMSGGVELPVATSASPITAILDSIAHKAQSPPSTSSTVFSAASQQHSSTSAPITEFSQSNQISSPPEPIPFPQHSQTDRKSPYTTSGTIDTMGSNFSRPSFSDAYSSSAYKSTAVTSNAQSFSSHKQSGAALAADTTVAQQSPLNNFQSFQSQSAYSSTVATQSSLYPTSTNSNSMPINSFPNAVNVTSFAAGYPSSGFHSRDSQSAPSFAAAGAQSSTSYTSDSNPQAIYNNQSAFGAASVAQKLSSTKLSDNKLVANDAVEQPKLPPADAAAVAVSSSLPVSVMSSSSTMTSPSASAGSVSVSTVLGLPSQSLHNLQTSKSGAASLTTKAPPNLPPGVPPLIGQNMYMAHHSFPMPAPFGMQQPMYNYEELLLSQQRLPHMPTPTSLAGMEHNKLSQAALGYSTGSSEGSKISRVDAQSPTNTATSQSQNQSAAHGQAFISPHNIPPGYGPPSYYYPAPPSLAAGGYSFPAPMIPLSNLVPQVTNASTSKNATYAYGSSTGTQDFSKAFVGSSQTQNKGSAAAAASFTSNTDLTAGSAASTYAAGKSHNQSFDKSSFATGTPPPAFNMQGLASGSQTGGLGAPAAAAAFVQYVPQAPMLAHQLHQDGLAASGRTAHQGGSQNKSLANKNAYGTAYWGNS